MYITPDYRSKGCMTILLKGVINEAKRQAGLEIRLYVHEGNTRAVKAYRKAGFERSNYKIMTKPL
jgi:ribosomal protein S18 acetylase RimI-like enzyme